MISPPTPIATKPRRSRDRAVIVATFIIALILGVALGSALGPPTKTVTVTLVTTITQAQATTTTEGMVTTSMRTSIAAAPWDLLWEYKADYVIKAVSISSDGNYIAAIGDNYDVGRNDVLHLLTSDGKMLWTKDASELPGTWIHDVSVSRNAARIVVGSGSEIYLLQGDGSVIWGRSYRDYSYLEGMNFVSVSDDGEHIAGGTYPIGAGWVYLLSRNGEKMWKFRTIGSVTSVSISMNGEYVAAGDYKSYVYLFDKQGHLLWDKKLSDYDSDVYVSTSPDGDLIAVTAGRRIGILNTEGNWVLGPFQVKHDVLKRGISIAGGYIFVAAGSEGLCVYDMKGALRASFKARESVNDVSVTSDATSVVVGSSDMHVYFLQSRQWYWCGKRAPSEQVALEEASWPRTWKCDFRRVSGTWKLCCSTWT